MNVVMGEVNYCSMVLQLTIRFVFIFVKPPCLALSSATSVNSKNVTKTLVYRDSSISGMRDLNVASSLIISRRIKQENFFRLHVELGSLMFLFGLDATYRILIQKIKQNVTKMTVYRYSSICGLTFSPPAVMISSFLRSVM